MNKLNLGLFILLSICCSKEQEKVENLYLGKLVKQGICMNYVIEVLDDDFPQELIERIWVDEFSKIEYQNVFSLESVCDFPDTVKEGDSFKFILGNTYTDFCAVCEAYTPVPNKRLKITVVD
ncbi:MAG: hypothetical protein ISQ43_03150 [Flavobacteriaceae bacterium]|nr:hypothetical protein [Flavobacteriaceae bacterium]